MKSGKLPYQSTVLQNPIHTGKNSGHITTLLREASRLAERHSVDGIEDIPLEPYVQIQGLASEIVHDVGKIRVQLFASGSRERTELMENFWATGLFNALWYSASRVEKRLSTVLPS
jgi:hypothetical protein